MKEIIYYIKETDELRVYNHDPGILFYVIPKILESSNIIYDGLDVELEYIRPEKICEL